ncbi:hypothetical protein [Malaciobacter mytili]|uniref:hypothetical protein n=1 Tax=Malaciobacter mytili TaxID=603050 RepID=UPI003A84F050
MQIYNIMLLIHLFCAIIFIGFLFADIFVIKALDSKYENAQEIKKPIYNKAVKIYPFSVLLLILSGGYMFSKYINSSLGYIENNLQILLLVKFFLVLIIALGILYSLSCKIRKKEPFKIMKHFHLFAFCLTIIITILAKIMFWV